MVFFHEICGQDGEEETGVGCAGGRGGCEEQAGGAQGVGGFEEVVDLGEI